MQFPIALESLEQTLLAKLRQLTPDRQQQVIDFVELLEKHQTTDIPEAQPFSLQDIAALPLAQRCTLLSPYMAAIAEDFAQDPDLTEFDDLDGDDIDYQPSANPTPSL